MQINGIPDGLFQTRRFPNLPIKREELKVEEMGVNSP